MGIVMLASAALLNQNYAGSIAWGCVAVLWTGWPFVGAIFAPFGLLMLAETAYSGKLMGLIRLLAGGLGILIGTATLPLVIDSMVYGKLTCPTLNILLYNAIGGSGDELYGVEPAAYYIKNLVLNTTIVWPISLMLPVVLSIFTFVRALTSRDVCTMASGAGGKSRAFWSSSWYEFLSVLTLSGAALLWQAVLFSRPHKEERFMYPIYPLIALSAAAAVRIVPIILGAAVNASTNGAANGAGAGQAGQAGQSACVFLTRLLWILPVLGLTLSASRLTSNYRNFYGELVA
jgi:alpha-1,2-mannosyltransferase